MQATQGAQEVEMNCDTTKISTEEIDGSDREKTQHSNLSAPGEDKCLFLSKTATKSCDYSPHPATCRIHTEPTAQEPRSLASRVHTTGTHCRMTLLFKCVWILYPQWIMLLDKARAPLGHTSIPHPRYIQLLSALSFLLPNLSLPMEIGCTECVFSPK